MRIIIICLALVSGMSAAAQTYPRDTTVRSDSVPELQPYTRVVIEASFKGNLRAFLEHVMRYPEKARRKKIEGIVMINFTVDEKGNLSDIKLDSNSPQKNKWLVGEAKRVIALSAGRWLPGIDNGIPVKSSHTQHINFVL